MHETESCVVKRKDSQLWGRAIGQEGEERNEEEEEGGDWETRVGVDRARWCNLPGLPPACDER